MREKNSAGLPDVAKSNVKYSIKDEMGSASIRIYPKFETSP
jgi:hypothetical protein